MSLDDYSLYFESVVYGGVLGVLEQNGIRVENESDYSVHDLPEILLQEGHIEQRGRKYVLSGVKGYDTFEDLVTEQMKATTHFLHQKESSGCLDAGNGLIIHGP